MFPGPTKVASSANRDMSRLMSLVEAARWKLDCSLYSAATASLESCPPSLGGAAAATPFDPATNAGTPASRRTILRDTDVVFMDTSHLRSAGPLRGISGSGCCSPDGRPLVALRR